MALRDVEKDCADILAAADLDLTLGEDLFSGPLPQQDGLLVACRQTGGDLEHLQGRGAIFTSQVQVSVSAPRASYREAKLMADAIWSALYLVVTEQYVEILPEGAAPTYLGPDGSGRHAFSINVNFVWNAEAGDGAVVPLNGASELEVETLRTGEIIFPGGSSMTEAPDLSGYLTEADAATTYETIAHASGTYLTTVGASNTYLSISQAAVTYATTLALSAYLTSASAASTYLPLSGGTLTASGAAVTPLTVKAAASQTAGIFKVTNNSNEALLEVDPNGITTLSARNLPSSNRGHMLTLSNPSVTSGTEGISAFIGGPGNYEGYFKLGYASKIIASNHWALAIIPGGLNGRGYVQVPSWLSTGGIYSPVTGQGDGQMMLWTQYGAAYSGRLEVGHAYPFGYGDTRINIRSGTVGVGTGGQSPEAYFTVRERHNDQYDWLKLAATTGHMSLSGDNTMPHATSRLYVKGRVEATDGVILTSPNGSRFQLKVANDGTLSTTAL